jgi:transcriptional regulator with XRE-family HTH domain
MMAHDLKEIGCRLKGFRNNLKLSQGVFALNLGISVATLSDIETGKKPPGGNFMLKISSLYGMSLDYLLYGMTDKRKSEPDRYDLFFRDCPFGEYTEELKTVLKTMECSLMTRSAIMSFAMEYLYRNAEFIKEDIKVTQLRKEESEVMNADEQKFPRLSEEQKTEKTNK